MKHREHTSSLLGPLKMFSQSKCFYLSLFVPPEYKYGLEPIIVCSYHFIIPVLKKINDGQKSKGHMRISMQFRTVRTQLGSVLY
jgi:hypothetical protein